MIKSSALASVFADGMVAAEVVPFACPCEFGPGGRYILQDLLSISSRSLVYRATDSLLSSQGFEATVIVKILRGEELAKHEALAARRVKHPNVVTTLDRGISPEGAAYVVSEYVEGGDLSSKAVPWKHRDAAAFVAKLARGVQASHSAGVVHCDLKPANVLVTPDGEPKLVDFDLAQSSPDDEQSPRGNLAFMSPEQFAREPDALTPLSDVYALGGLLRYLLTGAYPNGDSVEAIHAAHNAAARPPAIRGAGVLSRICQRAMERDRSARYHSAGAMADDLDRWLTYRPLEWLHPSATRLAALWARRHPAMAVGATALVLVSILAGVLGTQKWLDNIRIEQQTQNESLRLSQQTVSLLREKAKAQIRDFAKTINRMSVNGATDDIAFTVVWLEWIADEQVLGPGGKLVGAQARVAVLEDAIRLSTERGESDSLAMFLSKYALAELLVVTGRPTEAMEIVRGLQTTWPPHLDAKDPILPLLDALRTCAELASESQARRFTDAERLRLQEVSHAISDVHGARRMQRMIEWMLKNDQQSSGDQTSH